MSDSEYAATSKKNTGIATLLAITVLTSYECRAVPQDAGLLDLSIGELLNLEVTSASKKAQSVASTAAAVFVITKDDIQRTGARSIPEALRMAPGLEVAQIDTNKWAVSARGFNGRFANKLLVLMDGRALFTPAFGAVFWDVQDTLMENIERIEVIRGPGGALWGANAVNGVINIITQGSKDTTGGDAIGEFDTGPTRIGSIQYGGRASESLTYRVYAKYSDEAGNEDLTGVSTGDVTNLARIGLRTDWKPGEADSLSLTTEAYGGRSGETDAQSFPTPPYATQFNSKEEVSGSFANAQWEHKFDPGQELQTHFYYDATNRSSFLFGEDHRSGSVDVQYHFPIATRQDFVVGAGYRYTHFQIDGSQSIVVSPSRSIYADYNVFGQDQITLVRDHLSVSVGLNLEHNPLSNKNVDALPSVRLLWTLNDSNHFWAAVTKAIATPSFEQRNATVRNTAPVLPPEADGNPFPIPLVSSIIPNPDFRSERLKAYELGYRVRLGSDVNLDLSLYRNEYEDLWAAATNAVYCEPSLVPVAVNPLCVLSSTDVVNQLHSVNGVRGHTQGAELSADWALSTRFHLRAGYTYLHMALEPNQEAMGLPQFIQVEDGENPSSQFSLRGDLSAFRGVDIDAAVRYVSRLSSISIPEYWTADTNIVWHATPKLDLSINGRNLFQPAHAEFVSELADVVPIQIKRTIGVRFRLQF